jgi:uncharacterized protein (DUF488 family)
MKTSSFFTYKGDSGVCIALKAPAIFTGERYPALCPKWSFLNKYFVDHDEAAYIAAYHEQVLDKLEPEKVWAELHDKVLLCWEPAGKFCHRRLIAAWLEDKLGVVVEET